MIEKNAAVLTLNGVGNWTLQGRKEVAEWLRYQAENLVKDGENYTNTKFTAKYIYTVE